MDSAIMFNKLKKRCDKIISFFKTEMPKEFSIIQDNYFFRESFIDVASDNFLELEKMNKDFRFFPWRQEIEKKLDEKFGLKIIYH